MFKRKICPRCQTGKECYELDGHSFQCMYVGYYQKNKCSKFKPMPKIKRKNVLKIFDISLFKKNNV